MSIPRIYHGGADSNPFGLVWKPTFPAFSPGWRPTRKSRPAQILEADPRGSRTRPHVFPGAGAPHRSGPGAASLGASASASPSKPSASASRVEAFKPSRRADLPVQVTPPLRIHVQAALSFSAAAARRPRCALHLLLLRRRRASPPPHSLRPPPLPRAASVNGEEELQPRTEDDLTQAGSLLKDLIRLYHFSGGLSRSTRTQQQVDPTPQRSISEQSTHNTAPSRNPFNSGLDGIGSTEVQSAATNQSSEDVEGVSGMKRKQSQMATRLGDYIEFRKDQIEKTMNELNEKKKREEDYSV